MTVSHTWIVVLLLSASSCLGQVQLSWPSNPYVVSNVLEYSSNQVNWTTFRTGNGKFTNYIYPATNISTTWALVWVDSSNQNYAPCGQDFFRVRSYLNRTPVMIGDQHWFEADWERATNFTVAIKRL